MIVFVLSGQQIVGLVRPCTIGSSGREGCGVSDACYSLFGADT
jgi:hypothetical protein